MECRDRKVIGITGGIGSGKTMVLNLLKKEYGALVIEADKVAHELQIPGEKVYEAIVDAFGRNVLEEPCTVGISPIDRRKLGAIVFADEEKLKILNAITHPAVHQRISDIISSNENKWIFIEGAIITETSIVELTDELWYIYADRDVRLERLSKYRGISRERAMQIMSNQPDDEYFKKRCDVVIDNTYSSEYTLKQIDDKIKKNKIQEEHYE